MTTELTRTTKALLRAMAYQLSLFGVSREQIHKEVDKYIDEWEARKNAND